VLQNDICSRSKATPALPAYSDVINVTINGRGWMQQPPKERSGTGKVKGLKEYLLLHQPRYKTNQNSQSSNTHGSRHYTDTQTRRSLWLPGLGFQFWLLFSLHAFNDCRLKKVPPDRPKEIVIRAA